MQKPTDKMPEPTMDAAALCREEVFTDRKVGTIRRLAPVKTDGTTDTTRQVLFVGEAQILTGMGALPLSFEIPAQSLEEAISKFGPATKVAVERAMQELQEMRRQASSSIVIPERGAGALSPGGLPGGKIKLP
ncbi:MAG: hypothetical protein HY308_05080 [Gammaproteobacteria bacterium]|nr:hypothetical protein [Gammaproteobacteria bacterium]